MNKSIKQTLFIYISLSILIISLVMSLTNNLYFAKKDVKQHLDSMLAIIGLSLNCRNINSAKDIFIPKIFHSIHDVNLSLEDYGIQIYNQNRKLFLKSGNNPTCPKQLLLKPGFHNLGPWRIFVAYNATKSQYIVISEKTRKNFEITKKIFFKDLALLLLIIPLCVILLWLLISQSLKPLKLVIKQISTRNPQNLEPISIQHTPIEIQPIVLEVNKLLSKLKNGLLREQQFAADAAHEIRTPLATIKTLAQTALNSNSNDAYQKIIYNADKLGHVVNQLMNISKTMPEANKQDTLEEINLAKLISNSLVAHVPSALAKNIEIEFDYQDSCPSIMGNKIALDILIRNLIENSISYSYANSHIFVNLYTTDEAVVIEIRDQGPGIPKILQEKVFERFYRIDKHHNIHGTGLGLAIVKQIANLHNAEISLESPIDNKGVIVRIFFKKFSA